MCCTPQSHRLRLRQWEQMCLLTVQQVTMMSMDKNQLQYELNLERENGAIRNSGEISKLWFYIRKRHQSLFFVSDNSAHTANKCVLTCQLQITMAIEEIAFVNIKIELQHETVAQHLQKQSTRWVFAPFAINKKRNGVCLGLNLHLVVVNGTDQSKTVAGS